MPYRVKKIQELVHHHVAEVLQRDFRFSGAMVTVIAARVSSQRQHASVYISIIPKQKQKEAMAALQKFVYRIQQALNKQLRIRPVPKIRFVLDESGEQAAHIDQILKSVENG